jgi:adenylate cyclase
MSQNDRTPTSILCADFVGYGAALTQTDQALALERLQEHHDLLRDVLPMFQGREVKSTGPSLRVEFANPLAAVQCAAEIQRSLTERNERKTEERQIRTRIGIHLGDVTRRGTDVQGDGVDTAVRITLLAKPDAICVSPAVFNQIENQVPQRLVPIFDSAPNTPSAYELVLTPDSAAFEAANSGRQLLFWIVLAVVALNVVLFVKFGLDRKSTPIVGSTNQLAQPASPTQPQDPR